VDVDVDVDVDVEVDVNLDLDRNTASLTFSAPTSPKRLVGLLFVSDTS